MVAHKDDKLIVKLMPQILNKAKRRSFNCVLTRLQIRAPTQSHTDGNAEILSQGTRQKGERAFRKGRVPTGTDEIREGGAESNQNALDTCIKLSKKKFNKKEVICLAGFFPPLF